MIIRLAQVAVVVRDYDEAIAFYEGVLGFELLCDTDLGDGKRWVVVRPRGSNGAAVLLARAASERQSSRVGDQTGGRVFLFLETDDLARDHAALTAKGVRFVRPPREESYGKVAVFEDPYGTLVDLIEPSAPAGRGSDTERLSAKSFRTRRKPFSVGAMSGAEFSSESFLAPFRSRGPWT